MRMTQLILIDKAGYREIAGFLRVTRVSACKRRDEVRPHFTLACPFVCRLAPSTYAYLFITAVDREPRQS